MPCCLHTSNFATGCTPPIARLNVACGPGPADSLAFDDLAQFQGPALLAHNDATFSEADFRSISNVGDSLKRSQLGKTGRFGVGFNSCYHVTDLPTFISGMFQVAAHPSIVLSDFYSAHIVVSLNSDCVLRAGRHLVILDPQCTYLPSISSTNPGLRLDFVEGNAERSYPDQFAPYKGFGWTTGFYNGTLFRFPLRTAAMAAVSRISKQVSTRVQVVG